MEGVNYRLRLFQLLRRADYAGRLNQMQILKVCPDPLIPGAGNSGFAILPAVVLRVINHKSGHRYNLQLCSFVLMSMLFFFSRCIDFFNAAQEVFEEERPSRPHPRRPRLVVAGRRTRRRRRPDPNGVARLHLGAGGRVRAQIGAGRTPLQCRPCDICALQGQTHQLLQAKSKFSH